jgi:DNA-binding Lrp family transcriptional regulator
MVMLMVSSTYVIVKTDAGREIEIRDTMRKIKGVAFGDIVGGPYDILSRVDADSVEEISMAIIGNIRKIPGVLDTLSMDVRNI